MAKLDIETILKLAEHIENAELQAKDITKITDDYPEMDWEDAYDIQYEIRRRKLERGNRVIGLKMGLTSYAKMEQMGVSTPVYAFLADYFSVPDGGYVNSKELIHPKVEAEIAIITNKELKGPGCTVADAMAATEAVLPAVEIIDSRYRDFKFDLKSVIADNASSSRFVTGGILQRIDGLDLKNLGIVLEINGETVAVGAGSAVLGHPMASVAMLANMLAERNEVIPAGTFILTGGINAAVSVKAGDHVNVRFQHLGNISFAIK
jgi:2-oxo-3-hexenedioate decarboxylase